jgi:hypothetical protein
MTEFNGLVKQTIYYISEAFSIKNFIDKNDHHVYKCQPWSDQNMVKTDNYLIKAVIS